MTINGGQFKKGSLPSNALNLTDLVQIGQMFGNWCVQSSECVRRNGQVYVIVKCIIHGIEKEVTWSNLRKNKSTGCKSCSNLIYTELDRALAGRHTMIMQRCYNSRNPNYPNYGGRGILVEEQLKNKQAFIEYCKSLDNCNLKLQLDRIDNSRGYEIGNLRWVPPQDNLRNKRVNIYVTYQGQEMVLMDFARNYTYLSYTRVRVYIKQGWTLEQIANYRPQFRGRRIQSIRSGKLREQTSVYGRDIPSNDSSQL